MWDFLQWSFFVLKLSFLSSPARYIRTFDVTSEISSVSLKVRSRRGFKKLRYIRSFEVIPEVYCVSLRRKRRFKNIARYTFFRNWRLFRTMQDFLNLFSSNSPPSIFSRNKTHRELLRVFGTVQFTGKKPEIIRKFLSIFLFFERIRLSKTVFQVLRVTYDYFLVLWDWWEFLQSLCKRRTAFFGTVQLCFETIRFR